MPVHRVPGGERSRVYAYADELTAWLHGASGEPPPSLHELAADIEPPVAETIDPGPQDGADRRARPRRAWVAGLALVLIGVVASALYLHKGAGPWFGRGPRSPSDREAVELYRKGMHDWNTRTPEGLHLAVNEFTQAIVREPRYAEAYVGLANCYNLLREYTSMTPREAYPQAKAAALRAIQLDDSLSGGHLALAFEQFFWEWNGASANREYRRALQLDPRSASAHHWYANFLRLFGLHEAALAEINRAQDLEPTSSAILADKARILEDADEVDKPIKLLQQIVETNPAYLSPHLNLINLYLQAGNAPDAVSEMTTAARLSDDEDARIVAAAAERGLSQGGGLPGVLQAMLGQQLEFYRRGRGSAYDVARTYARLGDRANALRFLALSQAHHDSGFVGLAVDPAFRSLHGSAAYQQLFQALTARGVPVYKPEPAAL